tara:strand:+ start:9677 stop:9802 length:126 start_codon:yes stop_codon:yes gene_type:complete
MIMGINPISVHTMAINESTKEVSRIMNVIRKATTENPIPTP